MEPNTVACDDEDDDEDDDLLNDEIAFKIQTATQNAFLKGQNSGLSNAASTPSNAIMHSSPEICANASSTSLKNDVLDHIDKVAHWQLPNMIWVLIFYVETTKHFISVGIANL